MAARDVFDFDSSDSGENAVGFNPEDVTAKPTPVELDSDEGESVGSTLGTSILTNLDNVDGQSVGLERDDKESVVDSENEGSVAWNTITRGLDSDGESSFGGFGPDDVPDTPPHSADVDSEIDESDIEVSTSESEDDDYEEMEHTLFDEIDYGDFETPDWTTGNQNFKPFHVPEFNSETGPTFPANFDPGNASPWQYVKLFLTHDVLKLILTNTNKYAKYKQDKKGKANPLWKEDLTMPEFKAFLAINIVMGLSPTPQYSCFWSQSCFMGNEGVKKLMTKNRYEVICQYLHVSDRENEPERGEEGYDRAGKIRPLMDLLGPIFRSLSRPSKHQTIDEAMQKYKGRSSLMQYMKDKPCKRGLKFFVRNDSESGYCQEFELYLGKAGTRPKTRFGIYFDVINRLTWKIRNKNHRLYFDNLYTSIPVCQHLLKNGIYSCGTLRENRKMIPAEISKKRKTEERGWYITFQDKNNHYLTATSWKDTKQVRFVSTMSTPQVKTTCKRRSGARHFKVTQPLCAHQYNRFMNGTDIFDQKKGKYQVGRPSKKMWKYLLNFCLSACLVNAWILFKKGTTRKLPTKYGQLNFRLELVEEMTRDFSSRVRQPLKPDTKADHKNVHMGAKRPRRCKMHRQNFGKPGDTSFGCRSCGHFLCFECHAKLHRKDI